MPHYEYNYYAQWRSHHVAKDAFRDAGSEPPEALLQLIWLNQRLQRDALRTLDGRSVRVLHPGFANLSGGPDFRGAVLQFADSGTVSGDIEIDVSDLGWRAHGHDRNPAFRSVVLHVVWEPPTHPTRLSTLSLKSVLDASVNELSNQLDSASLRTIPDEIRGKCCAPLAELRADALESLLLQAALVRLQQKAALFRSRAQHGGWEQSLWEGLFRALGYRHNAWPMLNLAECRQEWLGPELDLLHLQSRLFGLSGLLPNEIQRSSSTADNYLRRIWNIWWREREMFAGFSLPKSIWHFHGSRPANHPHRRLALAAAWSCNNQLADQISSWSLRSVSDRDLLIALSQILAVAEDPFWSWHWSLRSARLTRPQPLLGSQRVTDLAINVILPWLLARATAGANASLIAEIERRFLIWPAAEDNALLRLARQRLLGKTRLGSKLKSAAQQQGLIQISRDFCDKSIATCDGCQFPALVRQWRSQTST